MLAHFLLLLGHALGATPRREERDARTHALRDARVVTDAQPAAGPAAGMFEVAQESAAQRRARYRSRMVALGEAAVPLQDEQAALAHIDAAVRAQRPELLRLPREKPLVLFDATGRYSRLTDSFMRRLDELGLPYVSLCPGSCREEDLDVGEILEADSDDGAGGNYDSAGMKKMMVGRAAHILYFLSQGFSVIHTDTDMYYSRDLTAEIAAMGKDVLMANDDCQAIGRGAFDGAEARDTQFTISRASRDLCAGFVFIKPTEFGKRFVTQWYDRIRTSWAAVDISQPKEMRSVMNDQLAMNEVVFDMEKFADQTELDAKLGLLLPTLVSPSCMVKRYQEQGKLSALGVYHANWMTGLDEKTEFLKTYAPAGYLVE